MLEVVQEGQAKRTLDATLPTHALLDVLQAMIGRTFIMWIYRGQKGELTDQSNALFKIVWRAMADPKTMRGDETNRSGSE